MTPRIGLLVIAASSIFAAEYTIDGARSSVSFSVRHLLVNNVRGQFSGLQGKITFDPKNLAASKVESSVDASSINTGIVKRDDHLRSADFFDVSKFPTLSFKSTKWARENGRIKVAGDLTMHGVTHAVVFDLELKTPEGGLRTGATVTGKINRQDFGLKWNRVMEGGGLTVSEEVSITLDIEATRK